MSEFVRKIREGNGMGERLVREIVIDGRYQAAIQRTEHDYGISASNLDVIALEKGIPVVTPVKAYVQLPPAHLDRAYDRINKLRKAAQHILSEDTPWKRASCTHPHLSDMIRIGLSIKRAVDVDAMRDPEAGDCVTVLLPVAGNLSWGF